MSSRDAALLAIGFHGVKQGTLRDENWSGLWGWNSGWIPERTDAMASFACIFSLVVICLTLHSKRVASIRGRLRNALLVG
jgi:hypothetical protein